MTTWHTSREIASRVIVTGDLVLESPAHLGNGESDGTIDMQLMRDARDERALLSGTSIAGALRAALQAYQNGYQVAEVSGERATSLAALLFGGAKGDDNGEQSPLIIDDALGDRFVPEVRDGVKIDHKRRIAQKKGKFDIELFPPGTRFPLRFELLLPEDGPRAEQLRAALSCALEQLEQGRIAIGARKSRGYGRARVKSWQVQRFNLRDPQQLVRWLEGHGEATALLSASELFTERVSTPDRRRELELVADFSLASPLLIRSEQPLTDSDNDPDFIHMRDGQDHPVIPGTSLAGVLRARAERILYTLQGERADARLRSLFGEESFERTDIEPRASRILVDEVVIDGGAPLVQQRVAIDRFTGGAYDTALFGEAPQVGGVVQLRLRIRNPETHEVGLALLLLKDLWTGDLPIGGASSVGRGLLRGAAAQLQLRGSTGDVQHWELRADPHGHLQIDAQDRAALQNYVDALRA